MTQFREGLFDLTKEQESTVRMMYNGKLIKCLVAPYHSFKDLESLIPYSKSTFLFPEREMSEGQTNSLISNLVESDITDDIIIITTQMGIILDMVTGVHVLTQNGTIVDSNVKTFMANIHTIRYELLENSAYQNGSEPVEKPAGVKSTNTLIDEINEVKGKTISRSEYDNLKMRVDMIGEDIIRNVLKGMLRDINVSKTTTKTTKTTTATGATPLDKLIDAYSKNNEDPEEYKELTYKLVDLYRLKGLSDQEIMMKI